jgi:hypothetical protein
MLMVTQILQLGTVFVKRGSHPTVHQYRRRRWTAGRRAELLVRRRSEMSNL